MKIDTKNLLRSVVTTLFIISTSLLAGHIDIKSDILTNIAKDKYLQIGLVFSLAFVNVKLGLNNDMLTSIIASAIVTIIFVLIAKAKNTDESSDTDNYNNARRRNMVN